MGKYQHILHTTWWIDNIISTRTVDWCPIVRYAQWLFNSMDIYVAHSVDRIRRGLYDPATLTTNYSFM